MQQNFAHEASVAAMKATPAVAVMTASVSGWSVQQWMYAATIGYIVLQAGYLCWKWWSEFRRGNRRRK